MPDSKTLDKDILAIRALAEVLEDTGLGEIELERGPLRVRISKHVSAGPAYAPAAMAAPAAAPQAPLPQESAPAAVSAPASSEDLSKHPGAVSAPMVGTAYMSPSPDAQPFVKEGASVSEGQTLMIVEAMKTMNEIKAPKAGTVTRILARDAEPVEYGETLMIIE